MKEKLSEVIQVVVTKKEKQMVENASQESYISISQLVRIWICEKLGLKKK